MRQYFDLPPLPDSRNELHCPRGHLALVPIPEELRYWDNVYGFDYSSIKKIALKEPLVDTVDAKAIVSTACAFKSIDILTVNKEDLNFKVPFSITANRDDYIHAFISWFDISFDACHKPVNFSTAPYAQYTHWKQTVFYTQEAMTVKKDETISGELTCSPNSRNPRDLDIVIDFEFNGKQMSLKEKNEYRMC
ncbi:hypothetical protein BGX26_007777 [Mortierella sp. AD094]|nr:hypothetical protein BGX26_007777 [Mortierella sp. AD094]